MPKVVDRAQKRREILDAASAAFSRHGYRGTNLQRVAAEAGIGKSSIYHYFSTKGALFDALVQQLLDQEMAAFDRLATAAGAPSERFEALLDAVTDVIDVWVQTGPLLLDCLREERGRQAVRHTLRRVRTALTRLIVEGQRAGEFRSGDPRALATVVVGCLDGVLLQRLLEPGSRRRPVDAELRRVLRTGMQRSDSP